MNEAQPPCTLQRRNSASPLLQQTSNQGNIKKRSNRWEENWNTVQDTKERKKIQNRNAQRTYRNKLKQLLKAFEQWQANTGTEPSQIQNKYGTEARPGDEQSIAVDYSIQQKSLKNPIGSPSLRRSSITRNTDHSPSSDAHASTASDDDGASVLSPCPHHEGSASSRPSPSSWSFPSNPLAPPGSMSESLYTNALCGAPHELWDFQAGGALREDIAILSDLQNLPSGGTFPTLTSFSQAENGGEEQQPPGTEKKALPPPTSVTKRSSSPSCSAKPRGGKTALHLTAENGWHTSVRLLLQKTCNAHLKDDHGRSPLHLAAAAGHVDVVRELLACPSRQHDEPGINMRDASGMTPLHIAAAKGKEQVVEMLLGHGGVDVHARVG